MNPRDRKLKNPVVKDDKLFEQKLIEYAKHQAREIQSNQMHLSPIVIAWAIDGYTTTSADNILLAISSSTKTKDHVKAQIIAAQEEQAKLPRNDLKLAIEKTSKLVTVYRSAQSKLEKRLTS
ncbi:MAG TPA: hypothetical protein VF207_02095 [Chthoniobacterales bacterium]